VATPTAADSSPPYAKVRVNPSDLSPASKKNDDDDDDDGGGGQQVVQWQWENAKRPAGRPIKKHQRFVHKRPTTTARERQEPRSVRALPATQLMMRNMKRKRPTSSGGGGVLGVGICVLDPTTTGNFCGGGGVAAAAAKGASAESTSRRRIANSFLLLLLLMGATALLSSDPLSSAALAFSFRSYTDASTRRRILQQPRGSSTRSTPGTATTATAIRNSADRRRPALPWTAMRLRREEQEATASARTTIPTTCVSTDDRETTPFSPFSSGKSFAVAADLLMSASSGTTGGTHNADDSVTSSAVSPDEKTRRLFFASSLIAAGVAVSSSTAANAVQPANAVTSSSKLQWETTPVNKRTGVTVFDAEKAGYSVRFVTYLSRFLLCFDEDCQRWWYLRAADLPRTGTAERIQELRLKQFAAFSASVEVGLQEYRDPETGPKTLLRSLLKRYCPDIDKVQKQREAAGLSPLGDSALQKMEREIREARRQIALLFGLMDKNQPVEEITKLLAAIDNGSIASVRIVDRGSGYAPGYGPPTVKFPPPDAGADKFETATGRATLTPNGRILRIDLVNRGFGYTKAPVITISPPAAIRFIDDDEENSKKSTGKSDDDNAPSPAQAKAFLFRSGPNKGRLERIQLTDPGAGYTTNEIIRVKIAPPDVSPQDGGMTATATAVLEYEVSEIQILNNGTGYAVEKPIPVYVEPPPLTARVNMNDPMMARIIPTDQLLPATTIPTREMLKKMPGPNDPSSVVAKVMSASEYAGKGGSSGIAGGGCVGRACYDRPVVAVAYPRAEKDSYNAYRSEDDALSIQRIETALDIRSAATSDTWPATPVVSGSSSGADTRENNLPEFVNFGGGKSSSSQLLSLLPAGVGLEFNSEQGRYQLASDPSFAGDGAGMIERSDGGTDVTGSLRALNPDFGPRGRSPIEREMEIGISSYLRFVASGAICSSGVHLALTPIDVVKTKVRSAMLIYSPR